MFFFSKGWNFFRRLPYAPDCTGTFIAFSFTGAINPAPRPPPLLEEKPTYTEGTLFEATAVVVLVLLVSTNSTTSTRSPEQKQTKLFYSKIGAEQKQTKLLYSKIPPLPCKIPPPGPPPFPLTCERSVQNFIKHRENECNIL